jgi:S1-C subfamily serine protease
MKKLLFLLLCLPQFLFSQSTEQEWEQYFKSRIGSLDPIEGIWINNNTTTYYNNCQSCQGYGSTTTNSNQQVATAAIYKKDGKFIAFNIPDNNHYTSTFDISAVSGVYFNQIKYTNTGYVVKSTATLTAAALLEFSYEKPMYQIKTERTDWREVWKYDKMIFKHAWIKKYPKLNESSASSGTGFALNSDGYIVTNYHVIDGATKIQVRGVSGDFNTKYDANIIVSDKNNDLAIIKVNKHLGDIPYKIKSKTSEVATEVYALGFPLRASMGDELKFTKGDISSRSGFQGDITTYQHTIPIQPGNSGGPMFDNNGHLIGIINARHTGAENASYSIKSKYLLNIIDESSSTISHSLTNLMYGKSIPEQVKQIRNFIYIIEVN